MKRDELEHVIRAAADVASSDEIVVIGSQAILGAIPDAPATLLWSQEADVYPLRAPERATAIDGALGDGSQFHATFGYYAHGVGPETAIAPAGWQARLVPVRVRRGPRDEREVVGWCMEPHDVVLAKCAAGRERDWEFAREALRHEVVAIGELCRRATELPLPAAGRDEVIRQLRALAAAT
ncbi:DUF6036 family nucleotidyltransferase [Conexibacter woesei]|uniref:DUF6036 domain-containing protein n=1 Tax=Conexibacter woesei (strain DSM 14684 / CCUG 47730 / CIP 108061 / JCM 11494 / NBRC 100937 / ID131577) TaxID=469383 RepID=D3FB45_CONWI|nr:DUF6036 family nucleotidyltransferase [Conexibacter woesei]ADB53237.1 conserved hypothetical protein [Conexibacter woesei DSM 14684]